MKDKKTSDLVTVNIDVPVADKKRPCILQQLPHLHKHTIEFHDGQRHHQAAEDHLRQSWEDTHHFVLEKFPPRYEDRQGMRIWSLTWLVVVEPNYDPAKKATVH